MSPLHVINRHQFMIFDSPQRFHRLRRKPPSLTFSDQISSNFARIPPPLDGPIYGRLQNSARIIPRLRVNTCVAPATRDLIKMKMYHNYHSIIFLYVWSGGILNWQNKIPSRIPKLRASMCARNATRFLAKIKFRFLVILIYEVLLALRNSRSDGIMIYTAF